MAKKNLGFTEFGKNLFIRFHDLAVAKQDEKLINFSREVLEIYQKYEIDSHIEVSFSDV